MHIREGELIVKTLKRHKTPYIIKFIKILIVAVPLYAFIIYLDRYIDTEWTLLSLSILSFFISIIVIMQSVDYLLDKLIITTKRVVLVDWKSIFRREEHEAELLDIQDIETTEKGILSKMRVFDYGFLEIETASSKVAISFHDCPDPEDVKHLILRQLEKARGGINEKRRPQGENEDWAVN